MDIAYQIKGKPMKFKGIIVNAVRGAQEVKLTFCIILWLTVFQTNILAQIFWQQTSGCESTHVKSIITNISNYYFAADDRGKGIYRSMDNGVRWEKINDSLTKKSVQALAVNSNKIIFAGTENDGVFCSSDYGNGWQNVTNDLKYPYINSLVITSTDAILVGTDGRGIFRSNNSGINWEKSKNDTLEYSKIFTIVINKKNRHIFAGTNAAGMYKSTDDGLSWKFVSEALSHDIISIAFNENGHIFAGTTYNGVYRSADDGEHWIRLADIIVNAFALNISQHIFMATDAGVFRSIDNGDTWTKFSTGLPDYPVLTVATDSAGRLFAGTSGGGIYRAKDAALPLIIHSHQTFAYNQQELPMELQATDDAGIKETTLFFRRGGDVSFMSLSLSEIADLYTGNIPSEFVTDRGVEYYITASDSFDNVARLPNKGYFSVRVIVEEPGAVNQNSQIAGSDQTAYRLLSVPLDLKNKTAKTVLEDDLGQYDDRKWRFYELRDDYFDQPDSISTYREYDDEMEIEPGKAYWLIVKEKGKSIDTGPGITLSTASEYKIAVHQGWNFIGNPFNFPVPIKNLQLKQGNGVLKSYSGEWKPVAAGDTLRAFEGLALFADSIDTLRINPDLPAAFSATPTPYERVISSIRIIAQCQQARDEDNLAVIASDASNDQDERDQPEPPIIGEFVSVYFPHRNWKALAKVYCVDARPELRDGEIWEFEIKTNIRDRINLSFEGLESVSNDFEVWLLDEALNIAQNLRETGSYSVAGLGTEYPKCLRLMVGINKFIETKKADFQLVPNDYELFQNFPNPFNPVTTIRFGLPESEQVTLKIFNLLGEEVITLVNDALKPAGYHVAIWDGRTKAGMLVANGIYFVYIQAGKFRQSRKMLLVH